MKQNKGTRTFHSSKEIIDYLHSDEGDDWIRTLYMTLPRFDIDEGVSKIKQAFEVQLALFDEDEIRRQERDRIWEGIEGGRK